MTMISAIASSSRCSAPCKPSHHSSSAPSSHKVKRRNSGEEERRQSIEHDGGKRFDVDGAKHISEKDREAFLSYGLFNIVAGKRTAELLEKQHRHGHDEDDRRGSFGSRRESLGTRRGSEPESIRFTIKHECHCNQPTKEVSSDFKKTETASAPCVCFKGKVSEKRSLKRVAKTTSRNLQEFFKRF